MDDDTFLMGGFDLGHMIIAFIVIGVLCAVVYCFWVWPCGEGDRDQLLPQVRAPTIEGRGISCPGRRANLQGMGSYEQDGCLMYAMELEPGTVVLQSSDGELFRVLHEYDSLANQGTPSKGFQSGSVVPVHYIPSYTRAHMQTRPSAPYISLHDEDTDSQPWRPLCVQSGSG